MQGVFPKGSTPFLFNQMKLKNIILGIKDQLPVRRLIRNIITGNVFGLFHPRSHYRIDGTHKVKYNTKATAKKAAEALTNKTGVYFSNYKCIFCDGYHLGKNRPPYDRKTNSKTTNRTL